MRLFLIAGSVGAFLASCASEQVRNESPLTIEDAKAVILTQRSSNWKDPDSIRDARIGQPYPCIGGLIHAAASPTACVCIEANAKNSFGGYTGLKQQVAYLHGRTVVDFQPPRLAMDHCDGLVLFPELNGKRP
jgi:hypothetical protein